MLKIVISIILHIVTFSACRMGTPVSYYDYINSHDNFRVAWSTEGTAFGDYWLMQFGDEYMLFKFKQPISETIGSGASHGECFRKVG